MINAQTLTKGLRSGFETTWSLVKVIFPITLAITLLEYTPVIGWIVHLFSPLMSWFGLPGDAAIPLALGNVLNLYAALGAILTLELSVKQVFILAVMLSLSHSLPIEIAVGSKIGVKAWIMALIRLTLAFGFAFIINLFWKGGYEKAQYGMVPDNLHNLHGLGPIVLHGLKTAFIGSAQIALIVILLSIGIQILKEVNAVPLLAKALSPLTRFIGASDKTGVTLMAGLIFGLAYGAGVMLQAAKEENLTTKDRYLIIIFLIACHSVIEDTLLFVPAGINIIPLLLFRLSLAIILTAVTAKIWSRIAERVNPLQSPAKK